MDKNKLVYILSEGERSCLLDIYSEEEIKVLEWCINDLEWVLS